MKHILEMNLPVSDNQMEIILRLDGLFSEMPGIEVKKRFKIPFYYRHSWVCYLNPIKKDGVELCFLKGLEMSNHDGKLQSKGRKMVAGISIYSASEIGQDSILDHFNEALILEEGKP